MSPRPEALSPQERLFAVEVRRAVAAANVSQDWVGRQIGLSRGKVSEMCSGRYLPQRDTMVRLVEALGMDRERALVLWQDARAARAEQLRTARIAREVSVVGWSRLPVLPAEIVSLLQAQILVAEEAPYRLRGARRPSLSTVYVRQELGSGIEEAQSDKRVSRPVSDVAIPDSTGISGTPEWRPGPVGRSVSPRPTVRPPARKVRVALDSDEHLLVVGGPGQGKSTLTLRLAADIARAWPVQPVMDRDRETVTEGEPQLSEPVVPLRLPARVLATRLDMPLPQALADSIAVEYGSMLISPVTADLLARRVAGCRWLLLIDAVDEVADAELRHRLIRVLSGCLADAVGRPYRLVVTSRPLDGGGLAPLSHGAARYELQPFDAEALRRFAEHWFSPDTPSVAGDSCHRFLEQIRHAYLDELVRVPLLATIAAIIFEQYGDRPLPDNRYGLYEEYLKYLAEARSGPTVESARHDGFRQLVWQLRSDLLEHLGLVRFEADVSLLEAAQAWIADHTSEQERPAHWQSALAVHLVVIGPLRIRGEGDEVQFLHHSFAEHLAATAKARLLPVPFNAENPAWQHAIHATRHGMATDHARAVVLHGTHLHKGLADQLVAWLHRLTADFQLIAAELLAQHAPVSPSVIDAFLDTARAWARTSSGTEIFQQVTRATHHPRLAAWLGELLHEPDMTWSARIEAATALCARVRSDVDDAVRTLRSAMDDRNLDLDDRRAAAQGLAQAGPEHQEAASRALRAVLEDPAAAGYTLCDAAIALADLGSASREHAVRTLRTMIADSTAPVQDHLQAAVALSELGTEFHNEAELAFRAIIDDVTQSARGREAALALGQLGPGYVSQAVSLLEDMINERRRHSWERSLAASSLADLGPEFIPLAAGHLRTILADPAIRLSDRWQIASELARLDGCYHAEAASHLRLVLADPTVSTNSLLWAARGLADLSPEFHGEAAEQLRRMHDDPLAEEWERCDAAGQLATLGPAYRDQASTLLRDVMSDEAADVEWRQHAASELIGLGTEFHQEVGTALKSIVADTANDITSRTSAALTLVGIDTSFRVQAADVVSVALQSPVLDVSSRQTMAYQLVRLGARYRLDAVACLYAVLKDPDCGWPVRFNAARRLVDLGKDFRVEAVAGIRSMLDKPFASPFLIQNSATIADALGAEFRAELVDILRKVAAAPERDHSARVAAATALTEFGQEHQGAAAAGLHAVLADPAADRTSQLNAAKALARLGREHNLDVATQLRTILATRGILAAERRLAAEALAQLGGEHLREATEVLRAVLDEQGTQAVDRRAAAVGLASLGSRFREVAATELWSEVNDPVISTWDQVEAAWQLANVDFSRRGDVAAHLASVVADTSAATADRCRAGEYLVRLARQHWADVTGTFRLMLTSPLARPRDRLLLVGSLTTLKALDRRQRVQIVLAIADDPTADAEDRCLAAENLMGFEYLRLAATLELQRELLANRDAPITARLVSPSRFIARIPLQDQKVAALLEVLTGFEFDTKDRFDALRALADLGADPKEKAIRALRAIIADHSASTRAHAQALIVLGGIDGWLRLEAVALADHSASEETKSFAQRLAATDVLISLDATPSAAVVRFLQESLREKRTSDRDAIKIAGWLAHLGRRGEAVSRLRQIMHDSHANPHIRERAAMALVRWSPTERATAATVLDALAGTDTTPSAARWRAAKALATLGRQYRDTAVICLRAIMTDPEVAASARAGAACSLMTIQPQHLDASVCVLRELAYTQPTNAAKRTHALLMLGSIARPYSDEAVTGLRDIASDTRRTTVARYWAARAMVKLRRDSRNEASLVTREIARNGDTSWHIRQRAARTLARWSPTARDEAHEMLEHFSLLAVVMHSSA